MSALRVCQIMRDAQRAKGFNVSILRAELNGILCDKGLSELCVASALREFDRQAGSKAYASKRQGRGVK